MRIAAIDIGTNSVHMIVVRLRADLSFEVIDREKVMVRLGAGGLDGKALTSEAMTAALQALSKFRRLAESHGVDQILAAATSATREARNGGEFLARVERETGIRPRVIPGSEEARLIHQAAVYGVDVGSARAVVIDIGGGSVEITLGTATSIQLARSFKIGVIRLTEHFVQSDPISQRDARKLSKVVLEDIDRHCDQITAIGFDRVIGTSGTILSLGLLAAASTRGAPPTDLRNLRVSAKQIRRLRKSVSSLDLESRLAMPGLDPRRADLVVAGAILLDTILRRLGAEDLTLCDLALREGLILDYVRRNRRQIAHVDQIPDVRRRSTLELAERCNYYSEHAQQVVRLALTLFDQTRSIHGLTDRDREWLEYAALMHDIGGLISFARHHRHSYYLIKNGDLRGFDPDEIEVIALVARYHRRGVPRKSHQEYADLPAPLRRTVRALASILRVAESLDRSHAQVISGVELRDQGTDLLIHLHASSDAELELWATNRYLQPFEQLVGKPVRLEVASPPPTPPETRQALTPKPLLTSDAYVLGPGNHAAPVHDRPPNPRALHRFNNPETAAKFQRHKLDFIVDMPVLFEKPGGAMAAGPVSEKEPGGARTTASLPSLGELAARTTASSPEVRSGPCKIEADRLNFYYGPTHALQNISVRIQPNVVTAFIGPSGCGKSTFLRTLNRMNDVIPHTRVEGRVRIDNADIYAPGVDVVQLRRRVGMVFQKSNPFPKSIFENVAYGLRINRMVSSKEQLGHDVEESLRRAALWDEVKDRLHESALALSGGQQQRLCIARALAIRPDILLMDEPASALDPIATQRIEELVYDLRKSYTIVIVTHNMQQAARVSDYTAFFWLGRLVEFDRTERIFTAPAEKLTEDYVTGRFG